MCLNGRSSRQWSMGPLRNSMADEAKPAEKTDKPALPDKPSGTELLAVGTLAFSESEPVGRVKLEIRGDKPRSFNGVSALPVFPLTQPNQMVQLYELKEDGSNGDMIGIIDDAAAL